MLIRFSTRKITIFLSVVVLILHLISTLGRIIEYLLGIEATTKFVRLFHVAEEGNITTYFSSLLLLFSALLLALIAKEKFFQKDNYARHWLGLAFIFLYLSVDEAARIHEVIGISLRKTLNLSGIFYYGWIIIMIPLLIVFIGFYLKFLWNLPKDSCLLFILSGGLFVLGALGMEVGGGYCMSNAIANWHIINGIFVTLEELLENVAIVVFIFSLLSYIKKYFVVENISLEVT
jgi:hypothetical protein